MVKKTITVCDYKITGKEYDQAMKSEIGQLRFDEATGQCRREAEYRCVRCGIDFCSKHGHLHHLSYATKGVPVCRECSQLFYEYDPSWAVDQANALVVAIAEGFSQYKMPEPVKMPPAEKLLRAIFGESGSHIRVATELEGIPLRSTIEDTFSSLTAREFTVLRLRFGFDDPGGNGRTLVDVGKDFNVTKERIRQIEAKALRKLRHPSRSSRLEPYMVYPLVPEDLTKLPVSELNISVRTSLCLERGGIATVGDIIKHGREGLGTLHNFGLKSMIEIEEGLAKLGLSFDGGKCENG